MPSKIETLKRPSLTNRLRAAGFTAAAETTPKSVERLDTSRFLARTSSDVAVSVPELQEKFRMAFAKAVASGEFAVAVRSFEASCYNSSLASACVSIDSDDKYGEECSASSISSSPTTVPETHDSHVEDVESETSDRDSIVLKNVSSIDQGDIEELCKMKETPLKNNSHEMMNPTSSLNVLNAAIGSIESTSANTTSIPNSMACSLKSSVDGRLPSVDGNLPRDAEPVLPETPLARVRGRKRAAVKKFFKRGMSCFEKRSVESSRQ
jgi:hypothetical protein